LAGKLVSRWKRIVLQYQPPLTTCDVEREPSDDNIAVTVESADTLQSENLKVVETERIPSHSHSQSNPKDEDLDLNNASGSDVNCGRRKTNSILDQTGLGSPVSMQEDDLNDSNNLARNIEDYGVAIQEESFDYELPVQEELREYDPVIKDNPTGYSCNSNESKRVDDKEDDDERDNVWDDFDEGAVSLGIEPDDFAQAECSNLWRSDNAPAELPSHPTPVRCGSSPLPGVAVTPLPDYQAMMTPVLKAELRRFGLKAVPRRKACQLLNHIYDQTHPLVPATPGRAGQVARRQAEGEDDSDSDLSQDSTSSQDSRRVTDMPEESIMYEQEEEEDYTASQVVTGDTLHSQLSSFVAGRPSLHASILQYEPVWLGQLAREVKEAGIKCKVAQIQDWLDIHCITFRTETTRNKNKVTKEKGGRQKKKNKENEAKEGSDTGQARSRRGRGRTLK